MVPFDGDIVMRFLTALLFVFCCSASSQAATIKIDVFNTPTDYGAGPYIFARPCYCGFGTAWGFWSVHPGDMVDFGQVKLYPVFEGSHSFPMPEPSYDVFAPAVGFDINMEIAVSPTFPTEPTVFDLKYVVPAGAHYIQIGWLGGYEYTPPSIASAVPEPSTWAMMILGFSGLGFMAFCQRTGINSSPH
jgi:hypothetical protein